MWMLWSLAQAGTLEACFVDPVDAREPYACAYRAAHTGENDAATTRIRAELQLHPDHAWGQLTLARLLTEQEQFAEAWSLARGVEGAVLPPDGYPLRLEALQVLDAIAGHTGQSAERARLLELELVLATEAEDTEALRGIRANLARVLVTRFARGDRPQGAVDRIEGLLDDVIADGEPLEAAQAWCTRSRLERFDGQRSQAEASARRCIDGVRALGRPAALREALIEHAKCASGRIAETSWTEAMSLATSDRDRALLELERLDGLSRGVDQLALRNHVADVRVAVTTLREAGPLGRHRLDPLESAAVALAKSHSDEALALADIQRGARAEIGLTLAVLQDTIPGNASLVVYLLPPTSDTGVAMVISRSGYRVIPLTDLFSLAQRVPALTSAIQDGDPGADVLAASLYEQLIQPLGLITDRVIVFPSGPLNGLSFAALGPPDARLGDRRVVSTGTTLSAWRARESGPLTFERAVLIADPEQPGDALAPVPHARAELAAVRAALGSDQPVWVGAEATPDALLDADADWIHLGAHVVVDDRFPERTAVHLANGQEVTAAQVREAGWKHPTVVLTSSRRAAGPVLGEGPLGMGRAFVDGGASAVISSLWPMRDADAARFFAVFYEELTPGTRLDLALARTGRKLAAEGAPLRAWAGVVLLGDGSRKLPEEPTGRGWLWGLAGVLGLLLLFPVALWWRWR